MQVAQDTVGSLRCLPTASRCVVARPLARIPTMTAGPPRDLTSETESARVRTVGVAYGLAAYCTWGFAPIYYKLIQQVSPWEILAHRVIWSVVLLLIWQSLRRRWREARRTLAAGRLRATLTLTAVLIALNWGVFIYAVLTGRVLQVSLGYFMNPLVSVLLGFVFLKERLRPVQVISVAIAAAGSGVLCWNLESVPWIAFVLAFLFGFYGLLRKTAPVNAVLGLLFEVTVLTPIALVYLCVLLARGDSAFQTESPATVTLLLLAGLITVMPLLWFTEAAQRLRLATVGFMQYIAPSGQFVLAVVAYGEEFTRTHLVSFALIWSALALYSLDALRLQAARRAYERTLRRQSIDAAK